MSTNPTICVQVIDAAVFTKQLGPQPVSYVKCCSGAWTRILDLGVLLLGAMLIPLSFQGHKYSPSQVRPIDQGQGRPKQLT